MSSRGRGAARWTCRPPSCGASSATCTTARRRGWARWGCPAARRGARGPGGRRPGGAARARRGGRRQAVGRQRAGRGHDGLGGAAVRVVIAEDQALLREGIVALLREGGVDVVAQAEDGAGLLRVVG